MARKAGATPDSHNGRLSVDKVRILLNIQDMRRLNEEPLI